MRGQFLKGAAVGAVTSTVVLMAASAMAGTGVGGVFNLGQVNSVNATTTLTGAKAGQMLQVTNTSTGGGATGISITVPSSRPPLAVSSSKRVPHLNADLVDGVDSTGFVKRGSPAGGDLDGSYPNPDLAAPEPFHVVSGSGTTQFAPGWSTFGGGAGNVAFYKDPFGVVHLRGTAQCTPVTGQTCTPDFSQEIFTLPSGYVPTSNSEFAVDSNLGFGEIVVKGAGDTNPGQVVVQAGNPQAYVALDGITFRAA
jgi:hypothetical protein